MFEDFTYITDEKFLSNYWLEEKVPCSHCHSKGKVVSAEGGLIDCPVCLGKKMIKRRQETHIPN